MVTGTVSSISVIVVTIEVRVVSVVVVILITNMNIIVMVRTTNSVILILMGVVITIVINDMITVIVLNMDKVDIMNLVRIISNVYVHLVTYYVVFNHVDHTMTVSKVNISQKIYDPNSHRVVITYVTGVVVLYLPPLVQPPPRVLLRLPPLPPPHLLVRVTSVVRQHLPLRLLRLLPPRPTLSDGVHRAEGPSINPREDSSTQARGDSVIGTFHCVVPRGFFSLEGTL